MIIIETECLIIRNYKEEDVNDIYEYLGLDEVSRFYEEKVIL